MRRIISLIIGLILIPSLCLGGIIFDGVDDYVNLGTMGTWGSTMDLANNYFYAVLKTSTTTLMNLVGYSDGGANTVAFQIRINSTPAQVESAGAITLWTRDSDGNDLRAGVAGNTGISDGNWHRLLVHFHPNNAVQNAETVTIWVDGVSQAITYSLQQDCDNMANFAVGLGLGATNISTGAVNFFTGEITEVAIWKDIENIALWSQEANNLGYSRIKRIPLQIDTSKILAYWSMDDQETATSADGDTVRDLSGNGNNGTGVDGANGTGLLWSPEIILSYPPSIIGN